VPSVEVGWQGEWVFDGVDSKGMPVDIDGRQRIGAKPSDLLPIALAACSATDLVQLLEGRLAGLRVVATYTQQPAPPWAFQRIRLHYEVTGRGLTEGVVAEAIRRSEQEMCSVAASLRPAVTIESSFTLREAGAVGGSN
jgi:putative redox protein